VRFNLRVDTLARRAQKGIVVRAWCRAVVWVASAWCLSGEAVAQATPQPMVGPLGFEVAPEAGSWRWRFVLSNRGDAPMPVVADRRLVWVEVAPPAAPQGVRRPRRRARVARCVHDGRPASNEASPEVVLGAGDRYAESFDLRDLCNLRVPAGLAEGATVVFHYGFAVPRRGRTRLSRSVVRDERAESVNDLTASVTVPAMPTALVPEEGHRPGANNEEDAASGLGVAVRVGRAVTAAGLRAAVTVTNRSVHPQWALWRPSLLAFEVEPPTGARVLCNTLTRQPSPHREQVFSWRRSWSSMIQRNMRTTLAIMLRAAGHEVDEAADGDSAVNLAAVNAYDLVITDLRMGGKDGIDVLRRTRRRPRAHRGHRDDRLRHHRERRRGDAPRAPTTTSRSPSPSRSCREGRARPGEAAARGRRWRCSRRSSSDRYKFENIVGRSAAIREVLGRIVKIAPTDATVLITGESGTGKELVAKAVHANSKRADFPSSRSTARR
jgi:CheY-like chemotaxis protein